MTVAELRAEVDRRKDEGRTRITLVVPGARHGRRARVFPGCMAEVVGHNCDGDTIVSAEVAHVDRALREAGA